MLFGRDTDAREVDFVVLQDKKPIFAVEVKTGEILRSEEHCRCFCVVFGRSSVRVLRAVDRASRLRWTAKGAPHVASTSERIGTAAEAQEGPRFVPAARLSPVTVAVRVVEVEAWIVHACPLFD